MRYQAVLMATLIVLACQTLSPEGRRYAASSSKSLEHNARENANARRTAPFVCPVGQEPSTLMLAPLPAMPDPPLAIPGAEQADQQFPPSAEGQDARNIRLDLCFDLESETATLKQVAMLNGFPDQVKAYPVEDGAADTIIQGITEAAFGDASRLSVEFPIESVAIPPQDVKVQIKGWSDRGGAVSAAILRRRQAEAFRAGYPRPIVGALVPGDPFPAGICAFAQTPVRSNVPLEADLEIELTSCTWPGQGETTDYRVVGAVIGHRGQRHTLAADDINSYTERGEFGPCDKALCIGVAHHNWCDRFQLNLDDLKVGLTTPSPFGCREHDRFSWAPTTEEGQRTLSYKIERGGELSEGQFADCGNFVFCNAELIRED